MFKAIILMYVYMYVCVFSSFLCFILKTLGRLKKNVFNFVFLKCTF